MSRRRNGLYLNMSRAGVKLDQREMGWLHLQSGRATISLPPPSPWRENNKSVNGKKESALSNLARALLILLAWNTGGGKNCGLDRREEGVDRAMPSVGPPRCRRRRLRSMKHAAAAVTAASLRPSLDGIDRDKRDEAKEEKEREEGRGEWASERERDCR